MTKTGINSPWMDAFSSPDTREVAFKAMLQRFITTASNRPGQELRSHLARKRMLNRPIATANRPGGDRMRSAAGTFDKNPY